MVTIGRRASDRDIPSIDHGFRNRALTTAKHRDGHRTTLQQSFGKVLSPTGHISLVIPETIEHGYDKTLLLADQIHIEVQVLISKL